MKALPAFLLFLLAGFARPAHAEEPLSLSIGIPLNKNGEGFLRAKKGVNAHFPVVITNTSAEPVRFWQEWCSWGCFALSFKLTDEKGRTWAVKKTDHAWTMNYPDFCVILPRESYVIEVYIDDPRRWDGFPSPPQTVTMNAVCEVKADPDSKRLGVWTGQIASPSHRYVFEAR